MDDPFNRPKTVVQWMLGNRCNYSCNYCNSIFYQGDKNFLTEDQLLEICKDIIYHYDELGRDVIFELLGGEPTLFKKLPNLGERLSNFPTSLIIKTNGSASLEWWQKARHMLSGVIISVHREFADIQHIHDVVSYLQDSEYGYPLDVQVLFPVTQEPESFNWGLKQVEIFQEKYGIGNLQVLYSNFGRGSSMYLPYSEEQWEQWHNFNPEVDLSKIKINDLQRYQPVFIGQRCHAGVDTLTIDPNGNVWRGWCGQGGKIGNIHEMPIQWPREPIICKKEFCHNGFDQRAKKEEI